MKIFWLLFVFHKKIFQENFLNRVNDEIYKRLKLPIWHSNNIKCETDENCPIPFACCNDAFFPMKDKYCCINYKKREYKYNYAYNN